MYDIETKNGYIFQMSKNDEIGITVYYNIYDTVYGRMLIASTEIGVCFVALGYQPGVRAATKLLLKILVGLRL